MTKLEMLEELYQLYTANGLNTQEIGYYYNITKHNPRAKGYSYDEVSNYCREKKDELREFITTKSQQTNVSNTVELWYRTVGVSEYQSIMNTNAFSNTANSTSVKYFGLSAEETEKYANKYPEYVAVFKVTVTKDFHDYIVNVKGTTHVDAFLFKSGTIVVEPEDISALNRNVVAIEHIM